MRKKLLSLCCAFLLMAGSVVAFTGEVQAEEGESRPMIDGSYLIQEDESVRYDTKTTRGADLLTGYSKAVRLGPDLFYAGGSTIASHVVDRVGIAVLVERAQEGDEQWDFYDTWQKFNENIDKVSANRQLKVEGGYYYRVRCTHSANDDMSSSFTDGVYIPGSQILPGIPEIG